MAKKNLLISMMWVVCVGACVTTRAEEKNGMDADSPGMAIKAFELRMTGQIEDAKAMLEQSVSQDPSCAILQYELARVYYHMGLGNPQNIKAMLEASQKCAEAAVESEPVNVIYHTFAGHVAFMRGYFDMHAQADNSAAKGQFEKACGQFESAIELKPDDKVAMLYLVEFHDDLPEAVGGNKALATKYAKELEGVDKIYAAKAHSILSPKDAAYWKSILDANPGNAEVLEELGKAYLKADKVDDAASCFEGAVQADPQKAYLFLDLSIYHTFSALRAGQGTELFAKHLTSGDAAAVRYLSFQPVQPMQAYALGVRSKYQSFSGDRDQGQALYEKAKALDPYFSKATGCPLPDLFISPKEVSSHHRYLMRPY
jgi:tetratricopeptide (TPR) repeat protein